MGWCVLDFHYGGRGKIFDTSQTTCIRKQSLSGLACHAARCPGNGDDRRGGGDYRWDDRGGELQVG